MKDADTADDGTGTDLFALDPEEWALLLRAIEDPPPVPAWLREAVLVREATL